MSRPRAARPAPIPIQPAASAPGWLRPTVVALAAVLLIGWFSTETADPDAWWHLKTGQYIWSEHRLPVPDPFAYTSWMGTAGARELTMRYFNLTHEWLAQLIFYGAYAAAGFPGLVLLRAAMLTMFCALVGLIAFRRSNRFYLSLAAALAAATVAERFAADRPFVLTFAMLAVTVAVLEFRRGLWLLPPLFLVWANCHGGVVLGWAALGAYCAEALWLRERAQKLWLAAAVSILVSGINPNGFRVAEVLLTYSQSPMQSALWEWHRPALWPPEAFGVLLFGGAAALAWGRRRTRPVDWLLFLAFAAASLMAVRNVILIGFFAPVLIAAYFPWKRTLPVAAEYAAAALLLAGIGAGIARGSTFQLRAAEWKYPSGAADFLLANRITGRIFNTYGYGGYLIWRLWPHQKVFIDGRALNETVFADYRRIANHGDRELLGKYGIDVIVTSGFEYASGAPFLLPASLADPQQTEWKLVYGDAVSIVFMRQPPAGVTAMNSLAVLDNLEAQCEYHIAHAPDQPLCASNLASLFNGLGDASRARRWEAFSSRITGRP